MSVIFQFSDLRKHVPSAQSQVRETVPAGDAEILIFPGVRIERQSLKSGTLKTAEESAALDEPAEASSAGGTDE